jgi:serine/threonine protein kinase
MTKRGPLGPELLRQIWKRSIPRVRFYRLPHVSGRFSWLLPFFLERIPQRFQPQYIRDRVAQRLMGRQATVAAQAEALPPPPQPGVVLPPRPFELPPPLVSKTELQGRKGRYQIHQLLGQRSIGQIYQAEQMLEDRPVVVKEYWLPDHRFNAADIRQRLGAFTRLAGVSLADGRVQDARLLQPWDAIADIRQERCYLIMPGQLGALPSLRSHLAQFGLMNETQVRYLLNQVLQTLECLHGQKYRLPSGQVTSGLAHGNLSLDSLLIAGGPQQFFIYACDLALWEHLFDPEGLISENSKPADDLAALGQVAVQLLTGQSNPAQLTEAVPPVLTSGPGLEPSPPLPPFGISPAFRAFLQRLLGQTVPFESATAARQALLHLPQPLPVVVQVQTSAPPPETQRRRRAPWWLLGLLLGTLLLTGLVGWWRLRPRPAIAQADPLVCCLADVSSIPRQRSVYTAVAGSSWDYVWQQPGLVVQNRRLGDLLKQQQPKFDLTYRPIPYSPDHTAAEDVLDRVSTRQVNFAISSLSVNTLELDAQTIAYDGLAVFVVFSSDQRRQSLPAALRGQISFAQLRQLYLEDLATWNELDARLPALPIRLYAPEDPEAQQIFEQRVLQTPEAIARFRRRLENAEAIASPSTTITRLPTFPLLRAVIQDFENEGVGAIAFAPLSQVYGQCAVYPLALTADTSQASPVQPLALANSDPIRPQTALCDAKGSYFPNIQAFRTNQYPLAYPLAVVYPRDNSLPPFGRKFAELFRTEEGQRLLSTAGLVPLQTIDRP